MATARQIEIYQLHKDVCISNGHPQTPLYHRHLEGTKISVGPQGLNTEYTQPNPRSAAAVLDAPVLLWMTWDALNLRGLGQDGGDTMAARMWLERLLIQFPTIDDSYNPIVLQDDDYIKDAFGTIYKIENPAPNADGSWWKAVAVVLR